MNDRQRWLRDPIFQFFSSLKLAIILLFVIILGCIAGTLYESGFDAKVARYYVYQAAWFNVWLLLLVANLTCSAFSRWPWKQHHVAFLVTHLGIITVLAGALMGRMTGIEGTMTIFKGEKPNSILTIDERILEITEPDGRRQAINAEVFNRKPSEEKPRRLTTTADGWKLSIVGYAPLLEIALNPKKADEEGIPAIRVEIETVMMGQKLGGWMIADSASYGKFPMGLAEIKLKRGKADLTKNDGTPAAQPAAAGDAAEIEEVIFAFAKSADQVTRAEKGGSSGAKVILAVADGPQITLSYQGKTQTLSGVKGGETTIEGTELKAIVEEYWPDFRIKDGKPGTVSEAPNNPAVLVRIKGRGVSVAPADAAATEAPNELTLFIDEAGVVSYELSSRKLGRSAGTLPSGEPLATGWADWALRVGEVITSAVPSFEATPVAEQRMGNSRYTEGVKVLAAKDGKSVSEWIPLGWQVGLETTPEPIQLIYGYRQAQLPVALQLLDFEVERDEGTDTPASFKSHIEVTTTDGNSAQGHAWMNNPFSYPGGLWRATTGLTYKISQASWNPKNLGESTVQILRDPGWSLKWIGSLTLTLGIYMMFYIPRFRRGGKKKAAAVEPQRSEVSV